MANPKPFDRKAIRYRVRRERSWFDTAAVMTMLVVALGVGAAASVGLQNTSLSDWLMDLTPAREAAYVAQSFPVCAGPVRTTCVIDGDTFWLDGIKIRIADINTPETGSPECAAEAALGRQATSRLAALLGAGPFTLARIDRDEDQYGRKLRIVERDGRSVGRQLVAEGLAHEWRGRRESWC